MVTEFQPRAGTGSRQGRRQGRRTDLTGLRALAIVALLLTGAGIGFVPGGFVGIDIFFVISGFLITGSLVGEWRHTGRVSLLAFYARRVRRLLPTAALVLAASLVLTLFCLPRSRWAGTGWDVLASGLSVLNWRLADQNADAFVPDATTSILAHYWALGVTGQVLLIWPVLLLGIASWAVRRRARDVRGPLLLTVGLVAVCSFAWSAQRTAADPERAFLGTGTRLWELALGAALALLGARLARLPRRLGTILGWTGAAAVVGAALVLRPGSGFPGYLALLPALGTAAIIVSGAVGGRAAAGDSTAEDGTGRPGTAGGGPHRILATRPMRAVGALCYPLYLWYWPLLVAAHARFGELHPAGGLAVLGGAALLAFLTHRYVETPIRDGRRYTWSPNQILQAGGLLPATAVVGGLLFQLTVWPPVQPTPRSGAAPASASPTPTPATPTAPGAAVLGRSPRDSRAGVPVDRVRSITPNPQDAAQDVPDVYRHDCFPTTSGANARACVYGDRTSTYTVVLAGDGHAASWVPALQAIAEAKRWRLLTYLNPNCPFLNLPLDARDGRTVAACAQWYDNVYAELTGPERPKLLLTTSSRYPVSRGGRTLTGADADEALAEGMRRTWSRLTAARVPTVVLRDVPVLGTNSGMCVSANPKRLTRCVTARRAALATGAGAAQAAAADRLDRVPLIDLNGAICPARECAPVIGGVLVYRDSQHLTATYARTLTPRLRSALDRILRSAP